MSDTEWHIAKAGANAPDPPISDAQLRDRLRNGDIGEKDLIWRKGQNTWLEARYFTWLLEPPDKS